MVVELPPRSQPRGRCASSVDSASQVAPTFTCPVALAQLQVCVPVGVVLGAGLGGLDQGDDLLGTEQVRVKGSSLFHFPVCPSPAP